jgi:inositol-phosphate phosphatase/L-galactose 1-phosphate phosphatase/histidinol-phosphatase
MTEDCPREFIDFAAALADAARPIVNRHFRSVLTVDRKSDDTPVTIADREAETAMRQMITERYPDHGIIGEEHGTQAGDADYVWVLDPIDGTKSFIAGKPIFGTLIALVVNDVPILGIIDQPVLGERWIGATGTQTTFNGAPVGTRACDGLDHAILNATSPDMFTNEESIRFAHLRKSVWQTQFGGDCYAYGLLASGFIDLVVEADLKTFDYCALVPVVTGAGGVVSDWNGKAMTLKSDGRIIAVGNPRLLPQIVEHLNSL